MTSGAIMILFFLLPAYNCLFPLLCMPAVARIWTKKSVLGFSWQ